MVTHAMLGGHRFKECYNLQNKRNFSHIRRDGMGVAYVIFWGKKPFDMLIDD